MSSLDNPSRRRFIQVSALSGGGLLLGFSLRAPAQMAPRAGDAGEDAGAVAPNAWITIQSDNTVAITLGAVEMGQGASSGFAMLIADELEADWQRCSFHFAPAGSQYANPFFGMQVTGGSATIRGFWEPARKAGAVARNLLERAAAERWGVALDTVRADNHEVIQLDADRRVSFGALAAAASTLEVDEDVTLKRPDQYRYIGKPVPRFDSPLKVDGRAGFGLDARVPGMLAAVPVRPPVFGGSLKAIKNAEAVTKTKGVRQVITTDLGAAVLADHTWAALQGRAALDVEWDDGGNGDLDDAAIEAKMVAALGRGNEAARTGDVDAALKVAAQTIEADYHVPYLAHATMEPMNCTADVREDRAEIWVPTQAPGLNLGLIAELTGLDPERITIHTTYLGGGFGRRFEQDFVQEAVQISMAAKTPVQLVFSREDDTRHDFYRPATANRLTAALDADGMPTAWRHRIAGPSVMSRVFPNWVENGIDPSSVEGAADQPYGFANVDVTYAIVDTPVPVGFWRSVGHTQNAYIVESFFDEVARAGGHDPVELRLRLLTEPRLKRVLEVVADKGGWGTTLPEGRFRGVAVAKSFGSYAAQIAECSLDGETVRVHRVDCAFDCGTEVNPNQVEAQIEGSIVYGLTAALFGKITIENGGVREGNFDSYQALRIDRAPKVVVHHAPSGDAPGGVGEPATPPIAPAVVNAVFGATGTPIRRLPIRLKT